MKSEEISALESMLKEYKSKDYYTLLNLSGFKNLSQRYMATRMNLELEILKQREKDFFDKYDGSLLQKVLAKSIFNELYDRINEAKFTFSDEEKRERYNNLSNQNINVANEEIAREYKKENFEEIVSVKKFEKENGEIDYISAFARLIEISKRGQKLKNKGLDNINGRAYDIYHLLNLYHYREEEITKEKIEQIHSELLENSNKLFGEEIELYIDKIESLNIAKMILSDKDIKEKYDSFFEEYKEYLKEEKQEKEEKIEVEEKQEEKIDLIEIKKNEIVDEKYEEIRRLIELEVEKVDGDYEKVSQKVDELINKALIEDAMEKDENQTIEEHQKELGNILILRNYPKYYGEKIYPKIKEGKSREEIDKERIVNFLKEKRPTFLTYKTEAADIGLKQNFLEEYSEVINKILGLEKGYKENIDFLDEI